MKKYMNIKEEKIDRIVNIAFAFLVIVFFGLIAYSFTL